MKRPRQRTLNFSLRDEPEPRRCEFPDCAGEGIYRAPRTRHAEREFRWFCLDHVRDFNRAWDYFAEMTPDQIDAYRREDVVGHRPTWRFGVPRAMAGSWMDQLGDLFGLFRRGAGQPGGPTPHARHAPLSPEAQALEVLELSGRVDRAALKAQYKILVKRHHPDANGGSKRAEERLKLINQAYNFLLSSGQF